MKTIRNQLLTAALVAGTLSYSPQGLAELENPSEQTVVAQEIQHHSIETPYVDYRSPNSKLTTADLINSNGGLLIDTSEQEQNWVVMIKDEQVLGYQSPGWLKDELLNDPAFQQHFNNPEQAQLIAQTTAEHMDSFKTRLMAANVSAPYQKAAEDFQSGLDHKAYHEHANSYANLDVFTLNDRFFDFFDDLLVNMAPKEHQATILSYAQAFATLHEIEHTNERNADLKKEAHYGVYSGDAFAETEYSLRTEIESDLTPLTLIYKDMINTAQDPAAMQALGSTIATWRITDTNESVTSLAKTRITLDNDREKVTPSDMGFVFADPNYKLNQLQRATHVSDIPVQALTALAINNPEKFKDLSFIEARSLSANVTEQFLNTPEMQQLVRSNRLSTGGHFTLDERQVLANELAQQVADQYGWSLNRPTAYPDYSNSTDGPTALALEQAGADRLMTQAPKEAPLLAATFWQLDRPDSPLNNAIIRSYPYDNKPAELMLEVPGNAFGLLETQQLYEQVEGVFLQQGNTSQDSAYISVNLTPDNINQTLTNLSETLNSNNIKSQPIVINDRSLQRMPEAALYQDMVHHHNKPLVSALSSIKNDSDEPRHEAPSITDAHRPAARRP